MTQLLYEIHLYALSEHFPHTCRHLHAVFRNAPTTLNAEYILGRHNANSRTSIITRALRYPLCTPLVLDAILRRTDCPPFEKTVVVLPRRLFNELGTFERPGTWKARHSPLPFLKYLYTHSRLPHPDPNSHDGYPLARAVHAGFRPLILFLIAHGASAGLKDGLAVKIAIQKRDLSLVKMLVEPDKSSSSGGGKRRKVADRVVLGSAHLRVAVQAKARDIIDYLVHEKGCVPDMRTLAFLQR